MTQSSRSSRHCWTSGSSLTQRTAEVPFQVKRSSSTEVLWRLHAPFSVFSDFELMEWYLCGSAGSDEASYNLVAGSPCALSSSEGVESDPGWIGAPKSLGALEVEPPSGGPPG